jgi:hypothetical protein
LGEFFLQIGNLILNSYDRCGGLVHIQALQLIDRSHHQMAHVFICGERPLSYQSDLKTPSKLRFANDRFRSI